MPISTQSEKLDRKIIKNRKYKKESANDRCVNMYIDQIENFINGEIEIGAFVDGCETQIEDTIKPVKNNKNIVNNEKMAQRVYEGIQNLRKIANEKRAIYVAKDPREYVFVSTQKIEIIHSKLRLLILCRCVRRLPLYLELGSGYDRVVCGYETSL